MSEECEECIFLGRRQNLLSKRGVEPFLLWPNGEQNVLYFLSKGGNDEVCFGVPGNVCLFEVQSIEGAIVKPIISPGFTAAARSLSLHKGKRVDKQLLYSSERGQMLPILRRCCFCWYYGERVYYGDGDISLWQWYTEIFSSTTDIKIPSFSVKESVCMAGLRKPEDVKSLLVIDDPEGVCCWQQRTCEP